MSHKEIIGLIPAAGEANRISPLPCSKEIFPIGFTTSKKDGKSHPKVISSYLLEEMKSAGVHKFFMVIREGKWDIPQYFLSGKDLDINIAYVVTQKTKGVPFTIDKAYPFLKHKRVAFGFPDILIQSGNLFSRLVQKQEKTGADLVLGLFKAGNPQKMDMVELDENNTIKKIWIKPEKTDLIYTWIIAVWSDTFTSFLHNKVSEKNNLASLDKKELFIGDIIQDAIDANLTVESVIFQDEFYIDIGTETDLQRALKVDFR